MKSVCKWNIPLFQVQHNPAVGSQSAFSLDLSLGRVAENANRPPAVPCKIDIYQDEHGKLKIYVPREEQLHEPEVSVQQSQQDNPRGTGIVSRNEVFRFTAAFLHCFQ